MFTEVWSYSYWHTIVLIHTGQGLGRVVLVMSLLRPRTKFLGAKTSESTDSPLEASYLVNMYYRCIGPELFYRIIFPCSAMAQACHCLCHIQAALSQVTICSVVLCYSSAILLASFPGPRPASRRLQYSTASDGKLGGGLGTRLPYYCTWKQSCKPLIV